MSYSLILLRLAFNKQIELLTILTYNSTSIPRLIIYICATCHFLKFRLGKFGPTFCDVVFHYIEDEKG